MVSKAKRRCCKGSLVRSREFIGDDKNLAGKNDDNADIFLGSCKFSECCYEMPAIDVGGGCRWYSRALAEATPSVTVMPSDSP